MPDRKSCLDDPEIGRRAAEIRKFDRDQCWRRKGGRVEDCKCYKAGPNGDSLPCPEEPK